MVEFAYRSVLTPSSRIRASHDCVSICARGDMPLCVGAMTQAPGRQSAVYWIRRLYDLFSQGLAVGDNSSTKTPAIHTNFCLTSHAVVCDTRLLRF